MTRYPLTVKVIWPRGKTYSYQMRFYVNADEAFHGLRWLESMWAKQGVVACQMPHGTMAPWIGDDGKIRLGRSGDVVTMLDDLGGRE